MPEPSGFLLVNKPSGITSFDVVRKLRGILGIRKLGHSGVLDRPAMGLLVVGANQATRLFELFGEFDKEYEADIWLGLSTTTDDLAGELLPPASVVNPTELPLSAIEAALHSQLGTIDQVPPAFSLTKVEGRELYRYALAGQPADAAPKRVTIHSIEVLEDEPQTALAAALLPPDSRLDLAALAVRPLRRVAIRLRCRGGVYVRSVGRDVGVQLGCGGAVGRLVRTRVGPFGLADAWTLEQLAERGADGGSTKLLPLSAVAAEERSLMLTAAEVAQVVTGKTIRRHCAQLPGSARSLFGLTQQATGEAELLALLEVTGAQCDEVVELHPRKVFGQQAPLRYSAAEA
jgi:tRNA pseudouridine55 synthase